MEAGGVTVRFDPFARYTRRDWRLYFEGIIADVRAGSSDPPVTTLAKRFLSAAKGCPHEDLAEKMRERLREALAARGLDLLGRAKTKEDQE